MYKYYNQNPLERKLPDCVCRAISLATRSKYEKIMMLLEANGVCYDCDELTVDCYRNILNEIGMEERDAEDKTVAELCEQYPEDILIVRLTGHLTCCINGDCYDIWDCSNEKADLFWIV